MTAQDLTGRLSTLDGKPQPGILVMAPSDSWQVSGMYRVDQTDSDGTFMWANVPKGDYLMFAFEKGMPTDYDDPET